MLGAGSAALRASRCRRPQRRPLMEEVHAVERSRPNVTERKPPGRATLSPYEKLLVGRVEAAGMLPSVAALSITWSQINSFSFAGSAHESSSHFQICEGSPARTTRSASSDNRLRDRRMRRLQNIPCHSQSQQPPEQPPEQNEEDHHWEASISR